MPMMTLSRVVSLASAVLVGASITLAPITGYAGPGPSESSESAKTDVPVEGPARPPSDPPGEQPETQPAVDPDAPTNQLIPPPPTFDPGDSPGIEFVVPPPESEDDQRAAKHESPLAATFPDPGIAPNDGNSMLVLSGTTLGVTLVLFTSGLALGLDYQTPLEQLLPGLIIPTAGFLAFAGGGLYLGIKRATAYHRWEAAYRVVGEPQGAGLNIGGTFTLLGAGTFITAGVFELDRSDNVALAASLIALGCAAAVATPIMYTIGARRKQHYARTGGWHRRPIPPIPGKSDVGLRITPLVAPARGGVTLGATGRF